MSEYDDILVRVAELEQAEAEVQVLRAILDREQAAKAALEATVKELTRQLELRIPIGLQSNNALLRRQAG